MTREDRRLAKRLGIMFFGAIGLLIAVGMINLWLYPAPEWMKGDAWYAGGICQWHGQVMPCSEAVKVCVAEGKHSEEWCSRK